MNAESVGRESLILWDFQMVTVTSTKHFKMATSILKLPTAILKHSVLVAGSILKASIALLNAAETFKIAPSRYSGVVRAYPGRRERIFPYVKETFVLKPSCGIHPIDVAALACKKLGRIKLLI